MGRGTNDDLAAYAVPKPPVDLAPIRQQAMLKQDAAPRSRRPLDGVVAPIAPAEKATDARRHDPPSPVEVGEAFVQRVQLIARLARADESESVRLLARLAPGPALRLLAVSGRELLEDIRHADNTRALTETAGAVEETYEALESYLDQPEDAERRRQVIGLIGEARATSRYYQKDPAYDFRQAPRIEALLGTLTAAIVDPRPGLIAADTYLLARSSGRFGRRQQLARAAATAIEASRGWLPAEDGHGLFLLTMNEMETLDGEGVNPPAETRARRFDARLSLTRRIAGGNRVEIRELTAQLDRREALLLVCEELARRLDQILEEVPWGQRQLPEGLVDDVLSAGRRLAGDPRSRTASVAQRRSTERGRASAWPGDSVSLSEPGGS